MIGVVADSADQDVICEFFELFKTPWEFYRWDRQYDVLICDGEAQSYGTAKLVVLYAGRRTQFDDDQQTPTDRPRNNTYAASYQGDRIPIYGDCVTFGENVSSLLTDDHSGKCVAYLQKSCERVLARVGYDLFDEVRGLLTDGQPPSNASIPALELHIGFLRDLIINCGVPLAEIPPVPEGHRFIACLTHDVDHPSICRHKWDHTVAGFLYRAVFASVSNLIRGRTTFRNLVSNWTAALQLPLIHLGLAKDFWRDFDHRYLDLEKGLRSTFFVIPFKNCSGKSAKGPAPAFRAANYGAQDIAGTIQQLLAAGCEVGLHGIDAWLDSSRGREELEEIRRVTGVSEIGVRMHWLYYDRQSPSVLEKAGAAYDSTMGYNETIGYRAGTTQVYKPLQASNLLELPLHIMDTALFYPDHLDLSPRQGRALVARIVGNADCFGGCLTINWHDRSLAPERLWDGFYMDLVHDLGGRGAWFSTAGQAVSWFRKRRSVVFEWDGIDSGAVRARVTSDHDDHLPGLRLRIHKTREVSGSGGHGPEEYIDIPFDEKVDTQLSCEVGK
jgi:hypothetical protein